MRSAIAIASQLLNRSCSQARGARLPSYRHAAAGSPRRLSHRLAATMAASTSQGGTGIVAVYVTVPDLETGRSIGRAVVESKLAACCNIIPGVESIYAWEGKVQSDSELLLMIKTREGLVPELAAKVTALHSYDTCEVIAVPVVAGNAPYLRWVMDSTKDAGGSGVAES